MASRPKGKAHGQKLGRPRLWPALETIAVGETLTIRMPCDTLEERAKQGERVTRAIAGLKRRKPHLRLFLDWHGRTCDVTRMPDKVLEPIIVTD